MKKKKEQLAILKSEKQVKKFNKKSYYFVLKLKPNNGDKPIVVPEKKKKKTTWIFLLCNIVIVGALLIYQFVFGETKPIGELFKESPYYRFLWLALGSMVVYYLCEATCYSLLLKKLTGKYQFGIGVKTAIVGKYWDSLTPFGSGGQFAQVAYINSKGYKGNTSTSVVVGKYVFFEFAFVALGITVLCLPCSLFKYGVVVKWLAFAGVMINLILTTFITLVSTNRKVCAVLVVGGLKLLHKMKIVKNYNKALFNSLRFIHNYQMSIKAFAKKPLLVLGEVLINALGLISMAMVSYLIYLAFNYTPGVPVEHGLIQILTMTMLCQYATTFIPIPGGSGAAEVSFAAMFGKLFDNGAIFWALLFWRLFTYYLFIIVGFFYTVLAPACRNRKNKKIADTNK